MSSCIFCQKEDDVRDRKIYSACEISDGKPCGPCTEYFELEAQIEETRKTLEQQLGRRRAIRENINRVHDPMLIRVPPEITAYIFELAASVDNSPDGAASKSLLDGEIYAPLPLGNVCGAWRDIAWDMPHLWTFMFARIRTVEDLPLRLDIATQWLSRSGECLPLSIHFHIDDAEDEDGEWIWEEFIPFIGLLNDYSSRWKDLCGVARLPILEQLYAEHQGAPMLQHLQLSPTSVQFGMKLKFCLGCKSLPQPRSVQFNNVFAPDFHIDWGCVTRLETNTLLVDTFLDQLPQLHSLKDLSVLGVDGSVNPQSRSVAHLTLEFLYIEGWDLFQRRYMRILLKSLILPSLRHLKVNLSQDRKMLTSVVSLIQRSSCRLSSLSLSGCPQNSEDLFIRLLDCANLIEELEIANISPDDGDFLAALQDRIRHRDDPGIQFLTLPNLQRLSFILDSTCDVPWKALLLTFDPSYVANQPQWTRLSIFPLLRSSDYSQPQELVHMGLEDEVVERLLDLVKSGIGLFLPRNITKGDLLGVMKAKADARAKFQAAMAEADPSFA